MNVLTQLCEALRPPKLPELTIPQINILNDLDLVRPTYPSDLARKRGVTRAAVSQSMRRLCALGLVERRRSDIDRRFLELRLTTEGDRLRRLPSSIDPERVDAVLWRLTAEFRYGLSRALLLMETGLAAALGRDFWREQGMARRDAHRSSRRWFVANEPRPGHGPGRRRVELDAFPDSGDG